MRSGASKLLYEDFALDCDRRELRRRNELLSVEPRVFDLLQYLIRNRDHVVSKDDLLAAVWQGRIVSEATLSSRGFLADGAHEPDALALDGADEALLLAAVVQRAAGGIDACLHQKLQRGRRAVRVDQVESPPAPRQRTPS
jgi:DNA-binding response OmpR family regulator